MLHTRGSVVTVDPMSDDTHPCKLSKFGFAKLLGTRGDEPIEYLIRKFEVILGRNSKNSTADVVLGTFPILVLTTYQRLTRHIIQASLATFLQGLHQPEQLNACCGIAMKMPVVDDLILSQSLQTCGCR